MNQNFPFTLAFAFTAFCGFAGYMANLLEMSSRTSKKTLKLFRAVGTVIFLIGIAISTAGTVEQPEEITKLNVFLLLVTLAFSSLLIFRTRKLLIIKAIEEIPFSEIIENIKRSKSEVMTHRKMYESDPGGVYNPNEPVVQNEHSLTKSSKREINQQPA